MGENTKLYLKDIDCDKGISLIWLKIGSIGGAFLTR
jgi:hypothetical protein